MSETIDFSKAIAEVETLIAKLKTLGVQADLIDSAIARYANNYKDQLTSLKLLVRAVEEQQKGILDVRKAFSTLVPKEAFNNLSEIQKQLGKVDEQGKVLASRAVISSDGQVKLNNQLSVFLDGQKKADTFSIRQANTYAEQQRILGSLTSGEGKLLFIEQQKVALERERLTISQRIVETKNGERTGVISDKVELSRLEKGLTFTTRIGAATDELTRKITNYNEAGLGQQAVLKEQIKELNASASAQQKLSNELKAAERNYTKADSDIGMRIALLREATRAINEQTIAEERLNNKLIVLQQTEKSLTDGVQRQIAIQQEINKGISQRITYQEKLNNEFLHQERVEKSIADGTLVYNEQLKLINKETLEAALSETKLTLAIQSHERALEQLNSTEGRRLETLKRQIREARESLNSTTKDVVGGKSVVLLTVGDAKNLASTKAENSAIERKNALLIEQANLSHTLTAEQARIIAQTEKYTQAIKEQNAEALKRARTEEGLIGTGKELVDLRQKRDKQIAALQAASASRKDPSFVEMQRLKAEIKSYDEYINRRINGSISESQVSSQLISSMRAGLNALGSSIGFFSAQTMLAASATYAFTSNVREAISQGAEFQKTLATAAATFELPTKIDSSLTGDNRDKAIRDLATLKLLEQIVTNLGSSSPLGLNEVAKGLVTIGQAGFDASQTLAALRPILDAAIIGNISVERATTIVSAAIHQFGMNAEGAVKVVDLLALGATKSSTTIENLGHALGYAGSVAKEVGWTIEETTSAIATMAKAGVDKDRAGTAMRKLAISLANPTTKESEKAIEKYGIYLRDAKGEAIGLFNILDKLSKIPITERTKTVNDIVGVYAAPGVTGLIQNLSSYVELETASKTQLQGMSERMRTTMEDNLESDFKLFKSSIEGLRKVAFDTYEAFLRDKVALFEKFAVSQNDAAYLVDKQGVKYQDVRGENSQLENIPKDNLAGFVDGTEQVITKFEILISKAEQFASVLLVIGGGLAVKNMTAGMSTAITNAAKDLTRYSEEWGNYAKSVGVAAGQHGQLSFTLQETSKSQKILGSLAREGSNALDAMAWATKGLGKALGALATAGTWAIALYGLYEVYQLLANDKSTIQRIIEERREVDNLKRSYAEAKSKIHEYYDTKERKSIREQIKSKEQIISDLKGQLTNSSSAINTLNPNIREDVASAFGMINSGLIATEEEQLKRLYNSLDSTSTIATKAVDNMSTADILLNQLLKAQEDYNNAAKSVPSTTSLEEYPTYLAEVEKATLSATLRITELVNKIKALGKETRAQAALTAEQRASLFQFQPYTPTPERGSGEQLRELEQKRMLLEQADRDRAKQNLPVDPAAARLIGQLDADRKKLLEQQQQIKQTLENNKSNITYSTLSSAEKLSAANKELAEVNSQMAQLNAKSVQEQGLSADQIGSYQLDAYNKLVERQGTLLSTINAAGNKIDKEAKRSASSLESAVEKAMRFYSDLQSKINPVEAITLKYDKAVKDLDILVKLGKDKGGIDEIDYQRTLIYLQNERNNAIEQEQENYEKLFMSQNKYFKTAQDMSEKYSIALGGHGQRIAELNNYYSIQVESVSSLIEELYKLDEAQKGGMSKQTADSISGNLLAEREYKLRSMFPKFETPQLPNNEVMSITNPFMQTAKDNMQISRLKDAIDIGYNSDVNKAKLEFDKEMLMLDKQFKDRQIKTEEEFLKKQLDVKKKFADKERLLDEGRRTDLETINEQMRQNDKQSKLSLLGSVFGSMSDILGQYASVSEDATRGQKNAFIAQKALAIAQILLYGEVAAMKAQSEKETFMGMTLATMIRAQAGASAGLVAGLAIAEYKQGSKGGNSKSNYSGAYDNGGTIPAGSWGIVGEYAPEIVTGPAKVISRKDTAKLLSESNQSTPSITIAPVINVTTNGAVNGENDGKLIGETVKAIVVQTIREQTRPNGYLDTFVRSKR